MRRYIASVILVTFIAPLALPAPASADNRTIAGLTLLLGGAGLAAGAFNWSKSCPDGYTTHRFQGQQTQCVYVDRFGSDVISEPTNAEFKRPALAWAGGAAVLTGAVLLFWPKRAPSPSITLSVTPSGVRAAKTIQF